MQTFCKICQGLTTVIEYEKKNWLFHRCTNCGFVQRDKKDYLKPEEEKARYLLHDNSQQAEGYVEYLQHFWRTALLPFASSGRRGLDFGCGPEPQLARLLSKNFRYHMDIYDLYFAPGKVFRRRHYDLITCTEVLEHLANPLEYFEFFRQHLEEDGILAVMTLLQPEEEDFLEWFYIRDQTHRSFFTQQALVIAGEKSGLKLIYSDHRQCHTFRPDNGIS